VLFLAAAAFVLSYDVLRALALENGVNPRLAWLWPLTLDAFMLAASLAVLRGHLNGEGTWYAWALVFVFSAASVAFNVVHARNGFLSRAIFALPPAVVFLAFHLLMRMVERSVSRSQRDREREAALAERRRAAAERKANAPDPLPFKCGAPGCDRAFASQQALAGHQRAHNEREG